MLYAPTSPFRQMVDQIQPVTSIERQMEFLEQVTPGHVQMRKVRELGVSGSNGESQQRLNTHLDGLTGRSLLISSSLDRLYEAASQTSRRVNRQAKSVVWLAMGLL